MVAPENANSPMPQRRVIARVAESSLLLVSVAALALAVTAAVTFAWGVAKVWKLAKVLLDRSEDSLAIVRLLEVIDVFLLGTVLVILAIGLVELFITELRLPAWLVIRDLGDLKGKFIDVLQLVAVIKFLEQLVLEKSALDVLWYGLAVAVVIGVLLAVRVVRPGK
ncbi:MAG: YqhA family protein [Actinomycetota bacterium]